MSTTPSLHSELRSHYEAESIRLRQEFSTSKDGLSYLHQKSALLDSIARRLWAEYVVGAGLAPSQIVFAAVGDFGRQTLFPFSEIDILFLGATDDATLRFKEPAQKISAVFTEIGLKCNKTFGNVAQVLEFDRDHPETILTLLDIRLLEGDQEFFYELRNRLIPEVTLRESHWLVERLAELTRNTHRKFANTVYHLEPNVKEGPGGFQDYVTGCWLAAISAMETNHAWPEQQTYFLPAYAKAMQDAFAFLASVRCFLQFQNKRDHNILTWELQDDAAARKIGIQGPEVISVAAWMRAYYSHAHAMDHISGQLLEEMPAAQSLFYRQLETWRTGFSDGDFSVVDGLIFFQRPENLSDFALSFPRIFVDRPERIQAQSDRRTPD